MQAVRTAVFYLLFMGQTVILAIIVGVVAVIFRRRTRLSWALATYWYRSNVVLLRLVAGIDSEVTGAENIPPGPCILAGKHQSNWDIFALLPFTDDKPAFIAKRELIDIPFFGWAAQSIDTISIDRKLGAEAIPRMLADARAALARGCRLIIFPEGTRKAPLAPPDYRQGIVRLYEALDVPVVPVALNSGLYWGRHAMLWPGIARARILPPILPGLAPADFAAELERRIETATTELIADAVAAGRSRPLGEGFVGRLDERKRELGLS
ncbi:MAG: 1-acyl-sn-glycerol-3-phosphate acyltransferase [Devosia sp.]